MKDMPKRNLPSALSATPERYAQPCERNGNIHSDEALLSRIRSKRQNQKEVTDLMR